MNILVTGDENVTVLGVNIKAIRTLIVLTSTLLIGYVVSHTGIIGFVVIIGANGSGKSTLLKNIYRFLRANSGEIYIKNKNIKEY